MFNPQNPRHGSGIKMQVLFQLAKVQESKLILMANYKSIQKLASQDESLEDLHRWFRQYPDLHHYMRLLRIVREWLAV